MPFFLRELHPVGPCFSDQGLNTKSFSINRPDKQKWLLSRRCSVLDETRSLCCSLSEHLASSRWCCFKTLNSLWEVGPSWRQGHAWSQTLRYFMLERLTICNFLIKSSSIKVSIAVLYPLLSLTFSSKQGYPLPDRELEYLFGYYACTRRYLHFSLHPWTLIIF